MTKHIFRILITIFTVLLVGCGGGSGSGGSKGSAPTPGVKSLPLLSAGKHLSMIKGFNITQPPQTNTNMNARWSEAIANGMTVGRIQIDWSELEPLANQYDKQFLDDALSEMQADGLQIFVLLSTIDSEGFTLPPDLVDSASNTLLASGMELDDPVILERFSKLLDWVVPMVVSRGGWVLSVGNEPGNFLTDTPSAQQGFVNFLASARTHAHSINPDLAITMTLAQSSIERGGTSHIAFLEQSDVASFNYYASDTNIFFDNDSVTVNQEIDQMLNVAGDKLLILQELGAAGGHESKPGLMNASLAGQQQFFETVFTKMEAEPRFRATVVFQLVDWDPSLVDTFFTQPFINEGLPQDFIDRFAESLETTGLIRYADGSSRPAWDSFIQWVVKFKVQ